MRRFRAVPSSSSAREKRAADSKPVSGRATPTSVLDQHPPSTPSPPGTPNDSEGAVARSRSSTSAAPSRSAGPGSELALVSWLRRENRGLVTELAEARLALAAYRAAPETAAALERCGSRGSRLLDDHPAAAIPATLKAEHADAIAAKSDAVERLAEANRRARDLRRALRVARAERALAVAGRRKPAARLFAAAFAASLVAALCAAFAVACLMRANAAEAAHAAVTADAGETRRELIAARRRVEAFRGEAARLTESLALARGAPVACAEEEEAPPNPAPYHTQPEEILPAESSESSDAEKDAAFASLEAALERALAEASSHRRRASVSTSVAAALFAVAAFALVFALVRAAVVSRRRRRSRAESSDGWGCVDVRGQFGFHDERDPRVSSLWRPGAAVVVHGLSTRAEANGSRGTLRSWAEGKGRWCVRLDGWKGELLGLRPSNLALVLGAEAGPSTLAGAGEDAAGRRGKAAGARRR